MRFRRVLALSLAVAGVAAANPREKRHRSTSTPPPASSPASQPSDAPTPQLLERVRALYSTLDYDAVIPLAEALLARPQLTLAQKLEAYRLLGSAKVIVEGPAEAEAAFRLLLRAHPDFELASDTSPKIQAAFRKVQSEERALADQLQEVERDRIVSGLRLIGEPPASARGGRPLPLSFRLRDPTGAVESVRVPYRRQRAAGFSTIALERSGEGDWHGVIPAEFTSDEQGFQMEYYIETADSHGPLLRLGEATSPLTLKIGPGTIRQAQHPPLPRWVFVTSVSLALASGATAGGLGLVFNSTQQSYRRQLEATVIDGAALERQRVQGEQLANVTNGALIALGVTGLATAILAPLTDFAPAGP